MNGEPITVLLATSAPDVGALIRACLPDEPGEIKWQLEVVRDVAAAPAHSKPRRSDDDAVDVYLFDCDFNESDRRALRQERPRVPVLLLGRKSAHEPQGVENSLNDLHEVRLGAVDFLWREELTPAYLQRAVTCAVERAQNARVLQRREAIRRAMSFAARRFLAGPNWRHDIDAVLDEWGRAAEVSRVYVFEHANYAAWQNDPQSTLISLLRYEWAAPGIASHFGVPALREVATSDSAFASLLPLLQRGEAVQCHTREFPESERHMLEEWGVRSFCLVPVFAGGTWWGTLGFNEARTERVWDEFELESLRMAADILGAAIEHSRLDGERARAEFALREVTRLNDEVISSAGEGIVVYDCQLRYVLWNPFMEKLTGLSSDDVLGHCALEVFPHLCEQDIDSLLQRALKGQRTRSRDVHFVVPQTGFLGWVQSTFEPLR
ncbi:MAG: hypothetical protein JWN98_2695, partial [Abditibacteriota bacterium]|nr:hypothetical protein [Abditibacteriota bacterium]